MTPSSHRRSTIVALVLAGLVASAAGGTATARGEDRKASGGLSGTYAIQGTFANGNEYTGTLEIEKWKDVELRKGRSFTMYKLKFNYSTDWTGIGVGVLFGKRFYFGLAHDGDHYTVAVFRPRADLGPDILALRAEYVTKNRERESEWHRGKSENKSYFSVKGDPWFTDVWGNRYFAFFFQGTGKWGTEGIAHEEFPDQDRPLGVGEWKWVDHWYDDKGKDTSAILGNSGDYVIEAAENGGFKVAKRIWRAKKKDYDEPDACVGLMPDPETMVVEYWGNGSDGVGYYDIVGNAFEGKISDAENPGAAYVQKATIPESVIARNPDLFK